MIIAATQNYTQIAKREIPGHPGYYADINGVIYNRKGHDLAQTKHYKGYLYVSLGARSGKLYAHRLIASTFIPNPDNKPHINHNDGNKANNRLSNLEWATNSENQIHAYKLGTLKAPPVCKGSDNARSTPVTYNGVNYVSITDAAKATGRSTFIIRKYATDRILGIRKAPK